MMSLSNNDLIHMFLAVASILLCSHFVGYIFQKYKQPQVIGEIVGGLLLGPTILKELLPNYYDFLFVANKPTGIILAAIYNAGLLLLMFCSGLEMRSSFSKEERKTSIWISITGIIIPVLLGILSLRFINLADHIGIAGTEVSFKLICITAIAVTSIPVISRIFYDLGILDTSFAKIVVSSAVVEDVILYVIVSIALSLAGKEGESVFGLPALLNLKKASMEEFLYHFIASSLFFILALRFGSKLFEFIESLRLNFAKKRSPIASHILIVLIMSGIALFFGISPMLGAFVAGIMVRGMSSVSTNSISVIKEFSFAFFIPIYFAIVGLKLNLIHAFDFKFFVFFLLLCCLIKIVSIYMGARLAGETHQSAINLGIAMNARGGPGIVLASLAYDANIINEEFYTTLILLAIFTSFFAGMWLGRVVRSGKGLR